MLHASIYGVLSIIEGPAPSVLPSEPVMAYIVPVPQFIPERPPPAEPVAPEEPIQTPPPEPEHSPAAEPPVEPLLEPDPPLETRAEPSTEAEPRPESTAEPTETATDGPKARPSRTRFEWYSDIPDAIARLRETEEQKPQYREFGNLDALTAGAKTATAWALDPPEGVDDEHEALPLETATWGEERVWLNDNCYVSRPAPGSVLAEVHRFTNPMMNCVGGSPARPQNDLFIEAKPDYLEHD